MSVAVMSEVSRARRQRPRVGDTLDPKKIAVRANLLKGRFLDVLAAVAGGGGSAYGREIARELGIHEVQVCQILRRLEDAGAVSGLRDGNRVVFSATPFGRRLIEVAHEFSR